MADIEIDAAILNSPRLDIHRIVFTTASIGYAFFIDADSDYKYSKTTDGGATWGSLVTVFVGSVRIADFWYDQWTSGDSGTLIHIWYMDGAASDVVYVALDTADDSLSTPVVAFDGTDIASSQLGMEVTGIKSRGGHLYLYTNIDNGTEQVFVRSDDAGATWDTLTSPFEAAPDHLQLYPGGLADNNDIWAIYMDASANELTMKTYDASEDTWSESAVISAQTESTSIIAGQWAWSGAVRHSDNHLILAMWTARDTATGDFRVFDITSEATITELTALATDKDDCFFPQVCINNTNGDIYVSFTGLLDGSQTLATDIGIYYVVSTDDGTTWSAENTIAETIGANLMNYAPPGGPRFMVAWVLVGANDALMTNADAAVSLSGGAEATGNPDINSAIWAYLQDYYSGTVPDPPDNTAMVTQYLEENPNSITDMTARFKDLIDDAQ